MEDLALQFVADLGPFVVAVFASSAFLGCAGAAAPNAGDAEQEAEVVPSPVVVDFVQADAVAKQADHKSDDGDHPVPEAMPKVGRVLCGVLGVTGCASCEQKGGNDGEHDEKEKLSALHGEPPVVWFVGPTGRL